MKNNLLISAAATLAGLSLTAQTTVVEWGVPSGGANNTEIVTGNKFFDNDQGTTSFVSVFNDATYNDGTYKVQSPLFYSASTNGASEQSSQVQNTGANDRIRIVQNNTDTDNGNQTNDAIDPGVLNDWEVAFAWDTTLPASGSLTDMTFFGYRAGNSTAPFYFLIQDNNGWYGAQATGNETIAGSETISMTDVTTESWYSFDQNMGDRLDSVGTVAQSVNFDQVQSVGVYAYMPGNTATASGALYLSHFQANAIPEPSNYALISGALVLASAAIRRRK